MNVWFYFWLGYFLSWLLIPVVLLAKKPPVSTLVWIWAIMLFPYLGPLAYALIGSNRLVRKHLRKRREVESQMSKQRDKGQLLPETRKLIEGLSEDDKRVVDLLSRINQYHATTAIDVRLLIDAHNFYPALIKSIDQARHHIHIEFFVWHADKYGRQMLDALIKAAQRGVQVRLLLDQGGCRGTKTSDMDPLVQAGGKFAWFRMVNPLQNRWMINFRNHRKIQIIDGEVAFIGGMNVGEEYAGEDPKYGKWRDMQLELHGHIAAILQHTFADDWYFATEEKLLDNIYYPDCNKPAQYLVQAMADGPDIDDYPIQLSIISLFNAAKKRAWITAGYFAPNGPLLTALKLCASRGVDTRLLISSKSDHPYLVSAGRSYYEELLKFGVRIFEYNTGINHAKVAAFDSTWTMIGSANFDVRSMQLNFEANVVIRDPETTVELERALQEDYAESTEIKLEQFTRRPFRKKFIEAVFRPFSPLF